MVEYWPGPGPDWHVVRPGDLGLSDGPIEAAAAYAQSQPADIGKDIGAALAKGHFNEPAPDGDIIGPTAPRGDPSGLIVKDGRIVAHWGDIDATEMTFSVAKSYLSICAGLAFDDGLIPDLDAPVGEAVAIPEFSGERNGRITWRHLLQQTSEWEGTLFTKPDRIDRNRRLDLPDGAPDLKGTHRDLSAPGGFWEYNDVRVNVLSLALTHIHGRSLEDVLRERVMAPLGAGEGWSWRAYDIAQADLPGGSTPVVPGGGHWGGGLFISARDHARVSLMIARNGRWGDAQVLSERWLAEMRRPCPLNAGYGFMWWLNEGGQTCVAADRGAIFAIGVGANILWVDAERDLVCVTRWMTRAALDGFARLVMQALP